MSSYVNEQFCLSPRIDGVGKYSTPHVILKGFYLLPVSRFTVLSPGISSVKQPFCFVNWFFVFAPRRSFTLHEGPLLFCQNERILGDIPNSGLYQVGISGWRWLTFSEPIITHYNQMTLLIARNGCWFKPPPRLEGHILFIVMRHLGECSKSPWQLYPGFGFFPSSGGYNSEMLIFHKISPFLSRSCTGWSGSPFYR